jgi:hypothetical protein
MTSINTYYKLLSYKCLQDGNFGFIFSVATAATDTIFLIKIYAEALLELSSADTAAAILSSSCLDL